jgi:hypothetical protein
VSHLRLGSLLVISYDSHIYGGGILTRLHTGLTVVLVVSSLDQVQTKTTLLPMVSRPVCLDVLSNKSS